MPERAVYVGFLLLFALVVGSYFVYQIGQVMLTFLLVLLLAVIVSAPVNYLARRGLSRGWSLALVAGAIVLASWLLGLMIAPVVEQQTRQFTESLPALLEDVETLAARSQDALGLDTEMKLELDSLPAVGQDILSSEMIFATLGFGRSLINAVSLTLVALIATVYLVVRPYPVIDGFVALFPAGWRRRVRQVLGDVYRTVQRWILGQLVAMTFIGVFSAAALALLGIPFAILLGLFSGLVSFIPFVGAVVSAIPPVLLALVSDDPVLALWVILAYTAIQQAESQVIQPVVMSRAVKLHPAVVLFAILIMGTLFGIVGLLLAVPLVAALQVLVRELWVKRMDGIGVDAEPPDRNERKKPSLLHRAFVRLQKRASRFR